MNLKIGDTVLVKRAFTPCESLHNLAWSPKMGERVGKTSTVIEIAYPFVLEKVDDRPKAARILTEKVMVGDTPCRKIMGFEGMLGRDELPKKYVEGVPAFWCCRERSGAHVFDGISMEWEFPNGSFDGLDMRLPDGVRIDVGRYCFVGMNVGDVWPEKTFQELLTWLKRAGSRLAKIRKHEKAAWSGQETIEI